VEWGGAITIRPQGPQGNIANEKVTSFELSHHLSYSIIASHVKFLEISSA